MAGSQAAWEQAATLWWRERRVLQRHHSHRSWQLTACSPPLPQTMSDGSDAAAARALFTTTRWRGPAGVVAPAESATAAGVHVIFGGKAVSMPSAAMSDASRPLQHASFSPPQCRSLLPRGLRACHGALRRLNFREGALASVVAHAEAATAAGVHAILGGEHAVSCHEQWLSCRCSTRPSRHHSVAACCKAASGPAMVLSGG